MTSEIGEGERGGRPSIVIDDEIARLFATGDPSTLIYELGRRWLAALLKDAADKAAPADLVKDAQTVRDWLGSAIYLKENERFFHAVARYLIEGRAPTQALADLFATFRLWLKTLYHALDEARRPINGEIRGVFDRLIVKDPQRAIAIVPVPAAPRDIADRHGAADDRHLLGAAATNDDFGGGEAPQSNAPRDASDTDESDAAPQGDDAGPDVDAGMDAEASGADTGTATPPRSAPPAGPHDILASAPSRLVDDAGNYRLDRLHAPADVYTAIRAAAARHGGSDGAISDAQLLDLADALGVLPRELDRRKLAQNFDSGQIAAARKLLLQAAVAARDAMAIAAGGSAADVMAYAEAKTRYQMIRQQVLGGAAPAGETLRALLARGADAAVPALGDFVTQVTGKTLAELRGEATAGAALETAAKVAKFIRDSDKRGFAIMPLEYWCNTLLSHPATFTADAVAKALRALTPQAGAGSDGDTRLTASLYGLLKGARQGVIAAWQAVCTGQDVSLRGSDAIAQPPLRVFAMFQSFRLVRYECAKLMLAYRAASQQGLSLRRDPSGFAAKLGEIEDSPSPTIMQQIRAATIPFAVIEDELALEQAWQQRGDANAPGARWLDFAMPLLRAHDQALPPYSPLGLLMPEISGNLSRANGEAAWDTARVRMSVGRMLAIALGSLRAQGLATGTASSDTREMPLRLMVEGPPRALRIGDLWHDTGDVGTVGVLAALAADLYDVAQKAPGEIAPLAVLLALALTEDMLADDFLRAPAEFIEAVTAAEHQGERYMRRMHAAPGRAGALNRYAQELRVRLDAVQAKTAWLADTVLPRRDVFGEPIPDLKALGAAGVTAIYQQKLANDPTLQAMQRLGVFPAYSEPQIRGVPLTDGQYDDFVRLSGRMMKPRLDAIIGEPRFGTLSPATQRDLVAATIKSAREAARTLVMMQNPMIITEATKAKLAPLAGAR